MTSKSKKRLESIKVQLAEGKIGYILFFVSLILTGIYGISNLLGLSIFLIVFGAGFIPIVIWSSLSSRSIFIEIKGISHKVLNEIRENKWVCELRILKIKVNENGDAKLKDTRIIRNLSRKTEIFEIPHRFRLFDRDSVFSDTIKVFPTRLDVKVDTSHDTMRPFIIVTDRIPPKSLFSYTSRALVKKGFPDPEKEHFQASFIFDQGRIPTLMTVLDLNLPLVLNPKIGKNALKKQWLEGTILKKKENPSEMQILSEIKVEKNLNVTAIIDPVDIECHYQLHWTWEKPNNS